MIIGRFLLWSIVGLCLAQSSCTKTTFINDTEAGDSTDGSSDLTTTDSGTGSDAETSSSDASSDDSDTPTDDSEDETVCGTLASGDRNITSDPRIDGFFHAVLNLQDELEFSMNATAAIMRVTAEDFDVQQEDRSMTEWAEAIAAAIENDIETYTTNGLSMDGNWNAEPFSSESFALEAEAWCENALGCNCDLPTSDQFDEFAFRCEGRCGNNCTCAPNDIGCENDDPCEDSCIGALTPSVCDTACDLAAGCGLQAAVQSAVYFVLSQIVGCGFVYSVDEGLVEDAVVVSFRTRMGRLYESLQNVYGESVIVRTRFDNEFANARCFDCSAVYIQKSIESFVDRLADGALLLETNSDRYICAVSAFTEASKLLADMTSTANSLMVVQGILLNVPVTAP